VADTYRVLVTGSRTWPDNEAVLFEICGLSLLHDSMLVIVHGAARDGADRFAALACRAAGVAQEPHPADWKRHNRRAGYLRNQEMADLGASLALAFCMPCGLASCAGKPAHDTHGTAHMIRCAERAGIPVRRITDG
jgi:hypothetical protein